MVRVLIIDDNDSFRKMLAEMLMRAGYEISEAVNGKIGVELYYKDPTELVITDIYMPEKDGREVIIELRQSYPDVKIIAISGGGKNSNTDYLSIAKNLGAQQIFSKPLEHKKFLDSVKTILAEF